MSRDAPFFIVGHPRSGTTLLRLMLNEHSRIVVPPESSIVGFFKRRLQRGLRLTDDGELQDALARLFSHTWAREWWFAEKGLDRDDLIARGLAAERTPGGVIGALMEAWCAREGKSRWGEKVPRNYRSLDEIEAWLPSARIVHLIRDGRDVAVSCLTPPYSAHGEHGDVYDVGLRWADAIRRGRRAAERLGPKRYHELHYEDLTTDPERHLETLCEFLGERFEGTMLDYHANQAVNVPAYDRRIHARTTQAVDRARVGRWRTEAPTALVTTFETLAGEELLACGYEPSGLRASAWQRVKIAVARRLPRRSLTRNPRARRPARELSGAAPSSGEAGADSPS